MKYYCDYSAERYKNTNDSSQIILTPFNKEYIFQDSGDKGQIERYSQLIDEVIEHTLKIKRFDVLSYYHDHNNSPSVRSLHSAKLMFLINGYFYYYHLYDNQLLLVSETVMDDGLFKKDRLYIFGVSDLLNLARFYSEFSFYASILDAGHLLYNVKNVLVNKNIDFHQYKEINSRDVFDHIKVDSRYSYISFCLEICPEYQENQMSTQKSYSTGYDKRLSVPHNEFVTTKYLREILAQYNDSTSMVSGYIKSDHIPFFSLSSKLVRNSAHTTIGNHNDGQTFDAFKQEEVLHYLKKSKDLFSSDSMEYCILYKNDKGEFIYWSDLTASKVSIDYQRIMYNDHKFFDMSSYSIVFVCFSNREKIVQGNLKNHLITSSEMMQLVALYSSSVGYAFRPMKNHNDSYLKEVLNLDERYEINFMGVVCNSPIQQLSYFLR